MKELVSNICDSIPTPRSAVLPPRTQGWGQGSQRSRDWSKCSLSHTITLHTLSPTFSSLSHPAPHFWGRSGASEFSAMKHMNLTTQFRKQPSGNSWPPRRAGAGTRLSTWVPPWSHQLLTLQTRNRADNLGLFSFTLRFGLLEPLSAWHNVDRGSRPLIPSSSIHKSVQTYSDIPHVRS